MKQYKVGMIRVLTTDDPALLQLHGQLIEKYYPMLKVDSRCIPDQPNGIHDDDTMAIAEPKIIELAKEMYADGYEAIIISCAGDPAIAQVRKAVPIPVIGAGASTAAISLFFGDHPAALGITADIPTGFERVFGEKTVGSARGDDVLDVNALMTARGYQATATAAQGLKNAGADVIALSCTGMSTIEIAPQLEKDLGIPVIDPVMCEGLITLFTLLRKDFENESDQSQYIDS